MMWRVVAAVAVVWIEVVAVPCRAQPSVAGAREILGRLDVWLKAISGTDLDTDTAGLQIRPQMDGYTLLLPLGGGAAAQAMTGVLRQTGAGWRIEQIAIPPLTEVPAAMSGNPVQFHAAAQSGAGFVDPAGFVATTGSYTANGVRFGQEGESSRSAMTEIRNVLVTLVVRPLFDGYSDVTIDGAARGFSIFAGDQTRPDYAVRMDWARASLAAQGTSTASTGALLGAVLGRSGTPGERASIPPLVAAFASGFTVGGKCDNLVVEANDIAGSLQSGEAILVAGQQGGLASAEMLVQAAGLKPAERSRAALGVMTANFLPTRLSLHPSLGNVSVAGLIRLAGLEREPDAAAIQALFGPGGIQLGLESASLDVAGATFTASASGVLTSPTALSVTGTISVTHFDLLSGRLGAEPSAAPIMPLVIFLKGVGRSAEDRLVWDVAYRDGELVVNGQNLTPMLQAFLTGAQAAPPPVPAPARPSIPSVPRPGLRRQ